MKSLTKSFILIFVLSIGLLLSFSQSAEAKAKKKKEINKTMTIPEYIRSMESQKARLSNNRVKLDESRRKLEEKENDDKRQVEYKLEKDVARKEKYEDKITDCESELSGIGVSDKKIKSLRKRIDSYRKKITDIDYKMRGKEFKYYQKIAAKYEKKREEIDGKIQAINAEEEELDKKIFNTKQQMTSKPLINKTENYAVTAPAAKQNSEKDKVETKIKTETYVTPEVKKDSLEDEIRKLEEEKRRLQEEIKEMDEEF